MNATQIKTESDAGKKAAWLEIVRRQVGSLRFGVVQTIIPDSQVAQIEKNRAGAAGQTARSNHLSRPKRWRQKTRNKK
jgi:hypothetical protein